MSLVQIAQARTAAAVAAARALQRLTSASPMSTDANPEGVYSTTHNKMHLRGEGGDITLPVNPRRIPIAQTTDHIIHDVFGRGQVSIARHRNLKEVAFDTLFWGDRLPPYSPQTVEECQEFFNNWMSEKPVKPKKWVVENLPINMMVLCEGFNIEYRESSTRNGILKDIYYELVLREYNPPRRTEVTPSDATDQEPFDSDNYRDDPPTPPSYGGMYTVVTGDTLSRIAQKHGRPASDWRQIYELNRELLHNNVKGRPGWTAGYLIFPGDRLLIPYDWDNSGVVNRIPAPPAPARPSAPPRIPQPGEPGFVGPMSMQPGDFTNNRVNWKAAEQMSTAQNPGARYSQPAPAPVLGWVPESGGRSREEVATPNSGSGSTVGSQMFTDPRFFIMSGGRANPFLSR